jgi:BolA family transcriptional regulator, general stress-responsive regulator
MSAETIARLQERLAALTPERVDVEDESHLHAGHAGAKSGGGHYRLHIVAAAFAGKNTVARHRLIYDAAGDLMRGPIHALSIRAFAPGEV